MLSFDTLPLRHAPPLFATPMPPRSLRRHYAYCQMLMLAYFSLTCYAVAMPRCLRRFDIRHAVDAAVYAAIRHADISCYDVLRHAAATLYAPRRA